MKKIFFLLIAYSAMISVSIEASASDSKEGGASSGGTIVLNKNLSHIPSIPELPPLPVIPSKEEIHKQVVKEKIDSLMPLNADEIRRLKMKLDAGREASQEPVRGTVHMIHETVPLNIGDATSPKIVFISAGKVSSFTFLDIKGKPWPIENIIVGQENILNVSKPKDHIAFLSTLREYGDLNIAFLMKDIDIPIYFHIKMNMEKAHESLTIALQSKGPESKDELITTETHVNLVTNSMYGFLDELPKTTGNAEALSVSGYYNAAWFMNGKMYIRVSSGEMISPAYDSYVSSAGGSKVYRLDYSPVLMFVNNGRIFNASIKRPEHLNDNVVDEKNNGGDK